VKCLDKRAIADVIERDYVNGDRSLGSIAREFNCSQPRITQIGQECVDGYAAATQRRWENMRNGFALINKARSLQGAN
jgi:hypothetical protein